MTSRAVLTAILKKWGYDPVAVEDGGSAWAVMQRPDAPSAALLDWEPNSENYACLTVADTGRGMDDTTIGKIFDPFFTDKFTGRGLGLPVLLGIVKASGGGVTVKSEPGRGSIFKAFFPLCPTAVPDEETAPDNDRGPLDGTDTVLVVDDMESVRNVARAMLERLDFDVITARDGAEAVDIFRRRVKDIRLVLTDLSMPGLNGWEVMAAVHHIRPDIPVILASGYDQATAFDRDRSDQPQAFLNKPYQLDDLKRALTEAWKSHPGSMKSPDVHETVVHANPMAETLFGSKA